jgi:hypothetical protein
VLLELDEADEDDGEDDELDELLEEELDENATLEELDEALWLDADDCSSPKDS